MVNKVVCRLSLSFVTLFLVACNDHSSSDDRRVDATSDVTELAHYAFSDPADGLTNQHIYSMPTPASRDSGGDNTSQFTDSGTLEITEREGSFTFGAADATYKSSYSIKVRPKELFYPDANENSKLIVFQTAIGTLKVNKKGELFYDSRDPQRQEGEPVDIPLGQSMSSGWMSLIIASDDDFEHVYINGEEVYKVPNDYSTASSVTVGGNDNSLVMELDDVRQFIGMLDQQQINSIVGLDLKGRAVVAPVYRPTPSRGMNNVPYSALTLEWATHEAMQPSGTEYQVEVATDKGFVNKVYLETTDETRLVLPSLEADVDYFWRVTANQLVSDTFSFHTAPAEHDVSTITAMEFNVWSANKSGTNTAPIHGSHYIAELIRDKGADIVFLTEGSLNAPAVAEELHWNYRRAYVENDPDGPLNCRYYPAILTRYDIKKELFAAGHGPNDKKVGIRVHSDELGEDIDVLLSHPSANDASDADIALHKPIEVVLEHERSRLFFVEEELVKAQENNPDAANLTILGGDLNSVSYLDLQNNSRESYQDYADVRLPITSYIHDSGFVDSYRSVHSDVNSYPGETFGAYAHKKSDRIDYIFHKDGNSLTLEPIESYVFSSHPAVWLSDHMGLVTKYRVN
ncbi:endonuclease/exonuclease/phosphatase family protein [Sinobacterium caligoides]|uniref:Endonuclease/exonuclease/phosphatase family protein n=1 Tax=Sinobacterium caligoides TaxID=933926 RepID=A0A3N2DMP4_9GAMM|nr:endonuclease/exonuclease/phosphatase family protein [Sinobacterium caligoides]ROS01077.1 endonuclease/exonuclease/phosphatase family protein [Sinobacterium caligoides]